MKTHVHERLDNFFNDTIVNIAIRLGYDPDNILILEEDENRLRKDYPETYDNLKSCKHQRDRRSLMEYAQDLVCSWVFEDYLFSNLRMCGLNIYLDGEDKNRKILSSSKVSANSDFLVEYNDKRLYIELANDYTGYWLKRLQVDLRDDKYLRLKRKVNNGEKSLLLGVDLVNGKYFIHDFSNDQNVRFINFHVPYAKPAYSIKLSRESMREFSLESICDEILDKFNI